MTHCRIFISVHGQLSFIFVQDFTTEFEYVKVASRLIIDFIEARIWDDSGTGAIERLVNKLKQKQVDFELMRLDPSSIRLLDSLSIPYAK